MADQKPVVYWPGAQHLVLPEITALSHQFEFDVDGSQKSRAVVAIIRSQHKMESEELKHFENLKLIITTTSGFDHIDFAETEKRGIAVSYTPEANAISAAEHTWALLGALAKQVIPAQQRTLNTQWKKDLSWNFEFYGKNLGIIGLGRVGQRVARIAKAHDMTVWAYDPYVEDEAFSRVGAERVGIQEVVRMADVLSLHVPKTHETERILNRNLLEDAADGLWVVNTSRSSALFEEDLEWALMEGHVAGAAIDVFDREPLPAQNRWTQLAKKHALVLSPHVGAFTQEAYLRGAREALKQLIAFQERGKVLYRLPLDFGLRSSSEI